MTPTRTPNARNAKPLKLAERDITRTCNDYLRLRGWRTLRINAGPFGEKGQPDYLMLHYARGLSMFVEYKTKSGRLGPKQTEWIAKERSAGALVVVVNDFEAFADWYEQRFGVQGQERMRF